MKYSMMAFVAVIFLVTSVHASNENRAGQRDKDHRDQTEAQINDVIYDLTVPWPFRKVRGIDTDGDGVVDSKDRCPGTPPRVSVDKSGCPVTEATAIFLDTGSITVNDITFDTKKATIKSGSHETLNEIGRTIEAWPKLRVEIAGHTDSRGSTESNQDLSERRAGSVKEYLARNFKIDSKQLVTVGYGESQPIASNDTDQGRAQNRRVEFKVLNEKELKRDLKRR